MMNQFKTRAMSVNPKTMNEKDRTVEAVISTEKPVKILDFEHGECDEILLNTAMNVDHCPLLDSHKRSSIENVIGTMTNIHVDGENLVGRAIFSSLANDFFTKVKEGHVTDLSVGFMPQEKAFIPAKSSGMIGNRSFQANDLPLYVITKAELKEVSLTPIGANDEAKFRSEKLEEIKKTETKPEIKDDFAEIRKAVEAERMRVAEISKLCQRHEIDASKYLAKDVSVDTVRAEILDQIAQRKSVSVPQSHAEITSDAVDTTREFVENTISERIGMGKIHQKADSSRLRMVDLIREMGVARCIPGIRKMDSREVAKMCFSERASHTSSDFPYLLANVLNKRVGKSYAETPTTYQIWCSTTTVPDFKQAQVSRISEGADLDLIPEGGDYPEETYTEEKEVYTLGKYGKTFRITWEAIVNDDLQDFAKTARRQGYMAKKKVNKLAYAVLTANAAMSDGTALFHANHNNLAATGGPISFDTFSLNRAAMRKQKSMDQNLALNLNCKYVIVPASLETAALQLAQSEYVPGTNQGHSKNIFANSFQVVVESELDASSNYVWYMAADQNEIDTVEVAFLEGHTEPYMDEVPQTKPDVREYFVRMPCVAKAIDWRGLYKDDGQA